MTKRVQLIVLACIICALLISCGNSDDISSNNLDHTISIGENNSSIDTSDNVQIPEYLYFQYLYSSKNNIPLNTFKKRQELVEWLQKQDLSQVPDMKVNESSSFFTASPKQYKLSLDGKIYYRGEVKDNYPDGFGMLTQQSEYPYNCETIIYIGEFLNGKFDGYGLLFSEAISEDGASLWMFFQDNPESEELPTYYHSFVNYVKYEGEFENGKRNGNGNSFHCSVYDSLLLLNDTPTTFDPEKLSFLVTVGEYEDGEENGSVKEYISGYLYYDGDKKNGKRSGKGIEYFLRSYIPRYDGEWKNDLRNGTGTLFDENGAVIYTGKWKDGDYA